jgi:hypothetical protein
VFGVRVASVTGLLAALAMVPALVDATTLPARWRIALAALGLPVVDRPVAAVIASGASVVTATPQPTAIAVDPSATGYRVRVAPTDRMLAG